LRTNGTGSGRHPERTDAPGLSRARGRAGPALQRGNCARARASSHRIGEGCASMIPAFNPSLWVPAALPRQGAKGAAKGDLPDRRRSERAAGKELPHWSVHSCTSLAFECSSNRERECEREQFY
jgi:hypothetical protein